MHVSRTAVAIVVCFALVAARLMGVHAHLEQPHDPSAPALATEHHDHGLRLLVSAHDPAHSESHLSHGDVDIAAPDMTAGKLPTMSLLLALIGAIFVLLALPRTRATVRPAPYHVPTHRRRIHVLPPSQAPPLAS
jgi:hypothetical protein